LSAEPASKEALALFKEGFECWNTGEIDEMTDAYADDAVIDPSAVFIDVAPLRGRTDLRRWLRAQWEIWEGVRLDVLEVLDLGEGRFVADIRWWGKGLRSGVEVDQRFASIYTLNDNGQVVRNQFFPDRAAALKAAERETYG
jgi:ketosteroid isomerase-like protein